MPQSAIVVDMKDNVATALRSLEQGTSVHLETEDKSLDIVLRQAVPMGHKFALKDIEPGQPIIKYGETIGRATRKIMKGEHTHVHNVEGLRGRGDRR